MNQELNLLPFNLEEALKNPENVICRNGEKPLEWHWFKESRQSCSICAILKDGTPQSYTTNGFVYPDENTDEDLMILSNQKQYWVNVYKDYKGNIEFGRIHESIINAEVNSKTNFSFACSFIKTIHFTI